MSKIKKYFLYLLILVLIFPYPILAYVPSDPLYSRQKYLEQIEVSKAWDIARGSGVVVAVIDSGVDLDHPDLAMNIWTNSSEIPGDGIDNDNNGYIDDVNGWNFLDDDNDPNPTIPEDGDYILEALIHGTFVSGIISAVANNGIGITGIAFQSKIMPLKILGPNGEGSLDDLIEAIKYAVNNGANIINLSLVGYDYNENFKNIVRWANQKGVLIVGAAGNDQKDLGEVPSYPICYGENDGNWVVGVGSVNSANEKSYFSNFGSCIDIMAPGENLFSTSFFDPNEPNLSQFYQSGWNGTSFATAIVSGVAALIKSKDKSLKPEDIVKAIKFGASQVSNAGNFNPNSFGGGVINAFSSLSLDLAGNGRLVKLANSNAVYYVDDGVRHLFSTANVFWSWYQGSWADHPVEVIDPEEFDALRVGSNITIRSGSFVVKFSGQSRRYVVLLGNSLCRVGDSVEFDSRPEINMPIGFESNYEFKSDCLFLGSNYPDGFLLASDDNDILYFLQNGKKRQVTAGAFRDNNFQDRFVAIVSSQTISGYPTGVIINSYESAVYPYKK